MKYSEYLKTDDWKEKRKNKLSKKKLCGVCADPVVDIHHLNYRNLLDVQQSDLRRLCRRCHFLAHDLYKAGAFRFRSTNHLSRWNSLKNAVKRELGLIGINMFDGIPKGTRQKLF